MKFIIITMALSIAVNLHAMSSEKQAALPINSTLEQAVLPEDNTSTTAITPIDFTATESTNIDTQKEEIPQKNALKDWQDNLKALLVKDAFWDSSTNAPTQEWVTKAEDSAKIIITEDSSLAEELKTDFTKTINDKFLNIEKGTSLVAIATVINDFNKKVDAWVQEFSPAKAITEKLETIKEPAKETEEKGDEPEQSDTLDQSEETNSESVESEKTELTEEEKKEKEKQKEENKLRQIWQETLDSIKSEGLTQDETQGMLAEIESVIKKMVESFPSEANTFKDEFLGAIANRKQQALMQFDDQSVKDLTALFNKKEELINELSLFSEQSIPNYTQKTDTQIKTENDPQNKKITVPQEKKPQSTQQSTQQIIVQQQAADNQGAILAQKAAADKIAQAQKEELQKSLASNIQKMAQKKAALEKTAAERGILSSIAGALFGEWWTGPNTQEKSIAAFVAEQNKELDKIIDKNLPEATKNKIKLAYEVFQKTLLQFNSEKYWDKITSMPNQEWIKKMAKASFILSQEKIISLENIKKVLIKTFKEINKKMTLEENEAMQQKTLVIFDKIVSSIENKQQKLDAIEQEKQQKIEAARIAELKKQAEEVQQQENAKIRQEQERIALIEKQKQDKENAIADFETQKKEWVTLVNQIAQSKPASLEKNNAWTTKALNITETMLNLIPLMEQNNQKNIIAKHIADFSNALLMQQENNNNTLNVDGNITNFNKTVHELSAMKK